MIRPIIYIINRLWPEPELPPEPEPLFFGYGALAVLCCSFLLGKSIHFILYRSYLRKKPRLYFNVRLAECVSSQSEWIRGMNFLMHNNSECPVLGLDCEFTSESSTGGYPKPAILQLANNKGYCAIFQLKLMEHVLIRYRHNIHVGSLIKMLENPEILKVGVGVMNDAKYLEESYGLKTRGCLDIRFLAEKNNIEPRGLAYLAQKVLGVPKPSLITSQPWESKVLTYNQFEYAAKDALLGVNIFIELNERAICRHYPWLRRLFWNEKTHWKYTMQLWKSFVDKHFCFGNNAVMFSRPEIGDSVIQSIPKGLSFIQYWPSFFLLESVERPRICEVCGACNTDTIMLKAIVPLDYSVTEISIFGDVLPKYLNLCGTCRVKSKEINFFLRERLTNLCGAPNPDYTDERLSNAQKYAKYLLNEPNNKFHVTCINCKDQCYCNINLHVRKANEKCYKISVGFLCKMFKFHPKKLTRELLEVIVNMDCLPGSEHGSFVSEFYYNFYSFKYINLDLIWCAAFVNFMKPTHLPKNWLRYCESNNIYRLNILNLGLGLVVKDA